MGVALKIWGVALGWGFQSLKQVLTVGTYVMLFVKGKQGKGEEW